MKTGIVVQARMGSKRLAGKMTLPFYGNMTLLEFVLVRLSKLGLPVVLATSREKENDVLEKLAKDLKIPTVRGSEDDLVDRFKFVAMTYGFEYMIRVCGDNPLIDTHLLMSLSSSINTYKNDYVGYVIDNVPAIKTHYGFFCEAISTKSLKKAPPSEHLTDVIYKGKNVLFKPVRGIAPKGIRLTIDTQEDFDLVKEVAKDLLDKNIPFNFFDISKHVQKNKAWMDKMAVNIKNNPK